MRKRELQFAEVDRIVELLRSAAEEGLTLRLTVDVEGTNYRGVVDTGATDFIAASRIVSDPRTKNFCAVKIGDGNYTYHEGEKEVEVVLRNF